MILSGGAITPNFIPGQPGLNYADKIIPKNRIRQSGISRLIAGHELWVQGGVLYDGLAFSLLETSSRN